VLEELDAADRGRHRAVGPDARPRRARRRDRPLRPAILWNDGRTQAQCEEIEARIGFERSSQLTGNRALAGFTAPKLLWLAEHEPDGLRRIAHILLPKDYVRLKLTDEHAIDVADASGRCSSTSPARLERRGASGAGRRSGVAADGVRVARTAPA
jgi:ribulose kinase